MAWVYTALGSVVVDLGHMALMTLVGVEAENHSCTNFLYLCHYSCCNLRYSFVHGGRQVLVLILEFVLRHLDL